MVDYKDTEAFDDTELDEDAEFDFDDLEIGDDEDEDDVHEEDENDTQEDDKYTQENDIANKQPNNESNDDSLYDFDNLDGTDDFEGLDNFDDLDKPNNTNDNIGNAEDYMDGAIAEDIDLHEDDEEPAKEVGSDFINGSGNIVVQSVDDKEDGFKIAYIDIDKIAITNRIRKTESVDALVQSIKSTGLLEPLVVAKLMTDDLYILLSGFRRIQACARAGKTRVPCIINTKVSTPEVPILEAMYNHQKRYSVKEQIDYIDYLEKEKGIMNPAMIEYLLQMNNGDYTKLKDILNDNDDDIVGKLYDGIYDIATAFKKLEQRRKKESREEKENKLAEGVYSDEEASGVEQIQGAGEEADEMPLTEEQIQALAINMESFDDDADDLDLAETVAEDDKLEGFEKHKQDVNNRECMDPAIRKATIIRDKGTCQCCKRGGTAMADCLDLHHVLPVFLGGVDCVDNSIMLCQTCHRMVHLYSTGDLTIDKSLNKENFDDLPEDAKMMYENQQVFDREKSTFKRIVYLGSKIRTGISQRGMNREQYKKEHSNNNIGRRMPGKNASQSQA